MKILPVTFDSSRFSLPFINSLHHFQPNFLSSFLSCVHQLKSKTREHPCKNPFPNPGDECILLNESPEMLNERSQETVCVCVCLKSKHPVL